MNQLFLFVVETNKKCNSDWIYIKETIDHFFKIDTSSVKLTPIYMDGKTKYRNSKTLHELNKKIKSHRVMNKSAPVHIIYCFDCDQYDTHMEDKKFLDAVQMYCFENNYEFVWFCKDIECVYLGKKVQDSSELHTKLKLRCFLLQPLLHFLTKKLFSVLHRVHKRISSASS